MKNKRIFRETGITLVALVVTIILLLILAGISIAQLTGSGLFDNTKLAKEKSENAQEKEDGILADYENKIGEYVNSNRETVTISKDEYEQLKQDVENLKPKSISESSKLMFSEDNNLGLGALNLKSFTNTFYDNFETYFSYDSTTGYLTCKKDGWYYADLWVQRNSNANWGSTDLDCIVNNTLIGRVLCVTQGTSNCKLSCNTITIFLNKGDILDLKKVTGTTAATNTNQIRITLMRL